MNFLSLYFSADFPECNSDIPPSLSRCHITFQAFCRFAVNNRASPGQLVHARSEIRP